MEALVSLGKKNKTGFVNPLSGLVYCADCGTKMYMIFADEKRECEKFFKRSKQSSSRECKTDQKRLNQAKCRLTELDNLIASVYEDKVIGWIPEDVCIGFLDKYQEEKLSLKDEISVPEHKESDAAKWQSDVDKFIRKLKVRMEVPELMLEMCMELIEFITVDERSGKYGKQPRAIHIYYKLIDKSVSKEQCRSWKDNK